MHGIHANVSACYGCQKCTPFPAPPSSSNPMHSQQACGRKRNKWHLLLHHRYSLLWMHSKPPFPLKWHWLSLGTVTLASIFSFGDIARKSKKLCSNWQHFKCCILEQRSNNASLVNDEHLSVHGLPSCSYNTVFEWTSRENISRKEKQKSDQAGCSCLFDNGMNI